MSNSNTTQESLELMKDSEKTLMEESVNKSKFISKTPSKKEVEKEGDENSLHQKTQIQTSNHGHARKRAKSNSKLKLMCSLAVCKNSSTPFVDGLLGNQDITQLHISCPSDKKEEKSTKDVSDVNSFLKHPSSLTYSLWCLASSRQFTKAYLGSSSPKTSSYSATRGAAWEARCKAWWFSILHCLLTKSQWAVTHKMCFSCLSSSPCWYLPASLCKEAFQQEACLYATT